MCCGLGKCLGYTEWAHWHHVAPAMLWKGRWDVHPATRAGGVGSGLVPLQG